MVDEEQLREEERLERRRSLGVMSKHGPILRLPIRTSLNGPKAVRLTGPRVASLRTLMTAEADGHLTLTRSKKENRNNTAIQVGSDPVA